MAANLQRFQRNLSNQSNKTTQNNVNVKSVLTCTRGVPETRTAGRFRTFPGRFRRPWPSQEPDKRFAAKAEVLRFNQSTFTADALLGV